MTRHSAPLWLALLAVAGCMAAPAQSPPTSAAAAAQAVCRIGPDGGPVMAESGIGGTGISNHADTRLADESGIGGTGVVGVITGFASICVNGIEISYAPGLPIQVDGVDATTEVLRAGEVTIISAVRRGAMLHARSIAIRHEVSGPIEAIKDATRLRVAGQSVSVPAASVGAAGLRVGEWVAVSGLRDGSGTILATRIDRRRPGPVVVHGRLESQPDGWHLADLPVRLAKGVSVQAGSYVVVVGDYRAKVLQAVATAPDRLAFDPAGAFGSDVTHFRIEAYVNFAGDRIQLGAGALVAAGGVAPVAAGRAVIELERAKDGSLVAAGLHAPGPAGGATPAGGPAAMDGPMAPGGPMSGSPVSGGLMSGSGPHGGFGGMGGGPGGGTPPH